jgi:hypothetical protein
MPQIILAGAVIAGAWLAARLMRKAFGEKPARRPEMQGTPDEAIIPLRQDPETGIYIPAERE